MPKVIVTVRLRNPSWPQEFVDNELRWECASIKEALKIANKLHNEYGCTPQLMEEA